MWEFANDYVFPTLGVILSIVSVPLAGLAGAVLVKTFNKLGLQVDEKNRDAFQTSITNAATLAVSKMGGPAATNTISQAALTEAVEFVEKSVPDAIKHFNITAKDIESRIKPQAEVIAQSVPTVVTDVLVPIATNALINRVRKQIN